MFSHYKCFLFRAYRSFPLTTLVCLRTKGPVRLIPRTPTTVLLHVSPVRTQAVKLFIDTTKVEILPVSDASAPIVRVDGTKVDVTPERPYSHTSHDAELFEVRADNKWFELVSKPYGISLNFNGDMLFVQVRRQRRQEQHMRGLWLVLDRSLVQVKNDSSTCFVSL